MADRSVVVRLMANIADFKTQMDQAKKSVKGVGDESEKSSQQATTTLGRMARSAQDNRAAWDDAGRSLTVFGAVTVAALGATVKAAVDWESAWAGVTKTVDGSEQQLAGIEQGLRGLARTLPATHGEIAAVAEAAGQLGVKSASIASFTKTMVDLGETTNLSAEEAATSIAQMMNVMRTAPQDVGRLGATLVALGNDGASTEKQIIEMAQRISGAAAVVGMSESDVLAFANAVASMGIEVESGGTSVSRVLTDMSKAAQSGGDSLDVFAKTAGMSAEQFSKAFLNDPAEAFASFISGLGGIQEAGGNVFAVLDDLGLSDVRVSQALLGMASSGDLLRESLDLGAKAWQENTALVEEASKRYDTTASKLEIARNNIVDAGIEIGDVFTPILADLAGGVADVASGFADLPDPIQASIGGLAGVAGVTALAGGGFLLLFPRVIETYKAFKTLRDVSPGTATALGRIGKAAGIATIVIAAASAVDELVKSMGPAPATMEETTKALLGVGTSMEQVDALFQRGGADLWSDDINGLADAAHKLANPSLIDRMDDFGGSLMFWTDNHGRAERTALVDQLEQVGQSLGLMVESGNAELAAEQFDLLAAEWKRGGGSVKDLRELLPAYEEALAGVDNEQALAAESAQLQAEKVAGLARDVGVAYSSLEAYAAALGMDAEATQELIDKSSELGESLGAFIDPLGAYTGLLEEKKEADRKAAEAQAADTESMEDSWEDYVTNVTVSFEEYMTRLQEQVKAQEDWQLNMLLLAGRVSEGTLAELARMGPEGADLVAQLVTRSDEELAGYDDLMARRSKEATDAWGAQLTLAAPVLAEIGRTAGQGVVAELAAQLAAGTTTVAEIAAQYGIALAGGINPILVSLGRGQIRVEGRPAQGHYFEADGGVMDFYSDGGMENHVAQIAQAGDWRVWAEPETGGEAYIPLSPAKRGRSVDIWRQVGDRLGVQFEEFAFGGITDVPRPRSTAPYRPPISTAGDATMQTAYDEVTAWLRANTEAIQGGTAGTGAVGGAWGSLWSLVKAQVPQARINSTFRAGDPGYHGRGKAIDFGFGTGPGGAGSAGLASINRLLHDQVGRNLAELIYDGYGDDRSDLKNGRPFTYSASTRGQHHNHVHAAVFEEGGILNPHVRDAGGPLLPGYTFNGTGAEETVIANQRFMDAVPAAPADGIREVHHHHAYDVKAQLTGDPDANARHLLRRMAKAERQAMAGVR